MKYCLLSLTQSVQAVAASSDAALDLTCLQPIAVHEGSHGTQHLVFELLDILCSGERDEMCCLQLSTYRSAHWVPGNSSKSMVTPFLGQLSVPQKDMNKKSNSSGVRQNGFGTSEMVEHDSYQNAAYI